MSDENKQLDELKAEMAKKDEAMKTQQAELEKLKKIFEERQTKALNKEDVLKKDELLKALGIEKDPEKSEIDLIREQIATSQQQVQTIQTELAKEREAKAMFEKTVKMKELARQYNFVDVDDALKFINVNSDNLEADLKNLAETKKYLVKSEQPKNIGSAFNGGQQTKNVSEFEKQREWLASRRKGL